MSKQQGNPLVSYRPLARRGIKLCTLRHSFSRKHLHFHAASCAEESTYAQHRFPKVLLTRRRVSTLPSRLHREAAAARHRSDVDTDLAHETGVARKDASATTGPAAARERAATDAAGSPAH